MFECLPPRPDADETILLVEDNQLLGSLLSRFLESYGYSVLWSKYGSDALRAARSSEIGLLVTDVSVPDMSGRQVADALRAVRSDLPVLYISGHPADRLFGEGRLPDDAEFIQKPFTLDELGGKVRSLLGPR